MKDDDSYLEFLALCRLAAPVVNWRMTREDGAGKYDLAETMAVALVTAHKARAGDSEAKELLASVDAFDAMRERVDAQVH